MEKTRKPKTIIIMLVVLLSVAILTPIIVINVQRNSKLVYVSTDYNSRVYHRTTHCKGLKNCDEVICVSKSDAQSEFGRYGRKEPCAYCYGKYAK